MFVNEHETSALHTAVGQNGFYKEFFFSSGLRVFSSTLSLNNLHCNLNGEDEMKLCVRASVQDWGERPTDGTF